MAGAFKHASFNVFEDLQPKPKSKKEDERPYSIFGVKKKRPTSKQRRSQILSALIKKGLRHRKPRKMMSQLSKVHVRGKKDRTKQDPPYFWGLPSILRRF